MNGQYFGKQSNTTDSGESVDNGTNSPVVNSDPFVDKVPVDAVLIHETPMGGTLAAVGPLNETNVHEAPMGETIPYEVPPVSVTIADEYLVSNSISSEAPMVETVPYKAPVVDTMTHEAPISTNAVSSAAILDHEESENFRLRWNDIQGKFVDEPRTAVQQADALVSEVIEHITHNFANEHRSLEVQWNHEDDVSTEDLRKALQHYRSFFNRLVV
jgi:hypothetical protein